MFGDAYWVNVVYNLAGFIYFAANTGIAVNYVLVNSIVANSILTAFDFGDVPRATFTLAMPLLATSPKFLLSHYYRHS